MWGWVGGGGRGVSGSWERGFGEWADAAAADAAVAAVVVLVTVAIVVVAGRRRLARSEPTSSFGADILWSEEPSWFSVSVLWAAVKWCV